MEYKIPEDRMDDVMSMFWQLLKLAENHADNENSPIDKLMVQAAFHVWNDVTESDHSPIWKLRKQRENS